MEWCTEAIVKLVFTGKRAYTRKWGFLGIFALVFFGIVAMLGRLDLLPEKKQVPEDPAITVSASPVVTVPASVVVPVVSAVPVRKIASTQVSVSAPVLSQSDIPIKVTIPSINLSVVVANPIGTTISVLDTALLKGAVRYPTSAKLGEIGNMVIFGHSSYLPIVKNKAFKAFNGIQKLMEGDTIVVYSAKTKYSYRVRSVAKENVNDAEIPLTVSGRVLTLATCDSFGTKADRFVVTADFVESQPIST